MSTSSTAGTALSRRQVRALLALILLWGAALRFYGLDANAHAQHNRVERHLVGAGSRMGLGGDWMPREFPWGSLGQYGAGAVTLLARLLSDLATLATGRAWLDLGRAGDFKPHLFIVVRSFLALASTLTVWLAWRLGRRLAGPAAGLVAAGLLAGSTAHAQGSQEATPEPLLGLFSLLVLLALVGREGKPSAGVFLAAGALVGMAAASKYVGLVLGFPVVVLAFARLRLTRALLGIAAALGAALLVYLALNPQIALHPEGFRLELEELRSSYATRYWAYPTQWDMLDLAWRTYTQGLFGLVASGFAVAGVGVAFVRRDLGRGLVASQWIAYLFALHATARGTYGNHDLPLAPALAVLGAATLLDGVRWLRGRSLRWLGSAPLGPLAVALVLLAGLTGLSLEQARGRTPSTEGEVGRWLGYLLARGESVLAERVNLGRAVENHLQVRYVPPGGLTLRDALSGPRYLLVNLSEAARLGRHDPARAAEYRRLLLDPRIKLRDRLAPHGWRMRGPTFAAFEVSARGTVNADVVRVGHGALRPGGDTGIADGMPWVRGPGSQLRVPLPFVAVPGEAVEVRIVAGADDAEAEPGCVMLLEAALGERAERFQVERHELQLRQALLAVLPGSQPEVVLRFVGGRGGRIYFERIVLRRVLGAAALEAGLGGRVRELRLLDRAGFREERKP